MAKKKSVGKSWKKTEGRKGELSDVKMFKSDVSHLEHPKTQGKTKEFSDYIYAYALSNALDFGKTDASRIIGKLFQHGLKKENLGEKMPLIQEIVKDVNSWNQGEREAEFEKYELLLPEKKEEDKELHDLPGIDKEGKYKGKRPVFRIAPFPSGALHLGNARTFILNAMYAEKYGGKLILVMDDTIGSEKKPIEKESYKLITDALKWLGVKYDKKIAYKSDRLKDHYRYAEKLIKLGAAYVDHSTQEEIRSMREKGIESGHRRLPVEVQMKRWEEMFKMPEGHATLRIKTDMNHPNPAFRDRVLFKISDREHPRVKKRYRVWPTLEMSWAVDDYLLGITHIIRGNDLLIETEMEKYIWEKLGKESPEVIHMGLIKIDFGSTGGKISKSKSRDEVASGKYVGWDDPRTWSIQSLKRRGIKAEAIREFVKEMGLNKHDITVPIDSLYSINRKLVDSKAERYYFVENPVMIKVSGLKGKSVKIPRHPDKPELRNVKISHKILVSKDDFETNKGKEVRLIHLCNLNLKNETEVKDIDSKELQKIQWVSDNNIVKAKILMPDGSWKIGFAESGINRLKKDDIIQFERVGFCRYDGVQDGVKTFWFAHK